MSPSTTQPNEFFNPMTVALDYEQMRIKLSSFSGITETLTEDDAWDLYMTLRCHVMSLRATREGIDAPPALKVYRNRVEAVEVNEPFLALLEAA